MMSGYLDIGQWILIENLKKPSIEQPTEVLQIDDELS